jgi:hypothetical protein
MWFKKALAAGRLSFFAVIFLALLFISVKVRQVTSVEPFIRDSYALSWDNYGYYLYLPATIIYKDPGIENPEWLKALNEKYQPERPFYQTWGGHKNRLVDVYPAGWAIGYSPFFCIAHLTAGWFGYPRDGLSAPYQVMAIAAAVFYGILGLWLLRRFLLHFFSDRLTALLLLLVGTGTNLYYYATYDCNLPHIFLFAVDCGILLLTISWLKQPKLITAAGLGLLLGLATITRPSEIVWVLVPLLWPAPGGWREKLRMLRANFIHIIVLGAMTAAVGSIQLLYWKYTTGHWLSYNHGEGFDFFRPFILEGLFSYKKGWLLYTPLMILAIAGLFFLRRKNPGLILPVAVFLVANTWFILSWECWWYAGTFGQRPFVQSYGLMMLPLGALLEAAFTRKWMRAALGSVLAFFVLLNQFQVWQVTHDVLHLELMTKNYYWKIFGRTHADPAWTQYLEVDRGNLPPFSEVASRYSGKELLSLDYESSAQPGDILCDSSGSNSKRSLALDSIHIYAAVFKSRFDSVSTKDHVRIKVEADIFLPEAAANRELVFALNMTGSRGQSYGYSAQSVQSAGARGGVWSHVELWFITPHLLHRDDELTVAAWNAGGGKVLLDNVKIIAFEPKE